MRMEMNLFYATAKPGSYEFSDTCPLRHQLFPLLHPLLSEHFDLFQHFFDYHYSLFRAEHLKHLLDEALDSRNPTLIEYLMLHPRTHGLFGYLSYVDR